MLSKAPSNGSPHGRLEKRQPLLSDLGDLSVFIDATYWYFLKGRANGVLLR